MHYNQLRLFNKYFFLKKWKNTIIQFFEFIIKKNYNVINFLLIYENFSNNIDLTFSKQNRIKIHGRIIKKA